MSSSTASSGKAVRATVPFRWTGAILLFLALFAPSASANTNLFYDSRTCTLSLAYCQSLSYYGVLTGTTDDTLNINGGWTFNAGIGVGTTSNLSKTGSNTANELVDFADTVVTNSNCTGTRNFCGAGTLSGTSPTNANATRVNTAEDALDNILSILAGSAFNTGNGTVPTLPNSGLLNIQSGITPGDIKIYTKTTAYTQSGALTFGCGGVTCSSNALVVVKLTGGNATFNHNINLADGLTPDQLLFYLPSNSLLIQPTAAATTVKGSFFLGSGNGTFGCTTGACDPITFYGRMYNNNGNLTFNNKGGSFADPGLATPEPGTWALMATGIGAFVWFRRRNRNAAGSNGE
jgi:hypothetical protein